MNSGRVIILSAPSGAGKTSIVHFLLKNRNDLAFSISSTTRPPRVGVEVDGVDYYFKSVEEFKSKIAENAFVEWMEVYQGTFYGTLKSEIERIWSEGKHVLADVDVVGGTNLKKYFGDKALSIFVKAPSIDEIEARLKRRGTETPESLAKRMERTRYEMTFENNFDCVVINRNLDEACVETAKLVHDFLTQM